MTQGILIFAFNSDGVDYVKMAILSAKRAKKFLNRPVSLVTDSKKHLMDNFPNDVAVFDNIIESIDNTTQTKRFYNGSNTFTKYVWKNSNRVDCYTATPYDETLVIDSDFIINSSFLSYVWEQPNEFLIYAKHNDLAGWRNTSEFEFVSEQSIPFYWATVFYFKKSKHNESFFSLIRHIKENWIYFVKLYQLNSTKFRNDIAFSIAIHMMNGFTTGNFATPIANKLTYTLDRDFLIKQNDQSMTFLVQANNSTDTYTLVKTANLDVHVMNKSSLLNIMGEYNV
jgi:hypothetical protein